MSNLLLTNDFPTDLTRDGPDAYIGYIPGKTSGYQKENNRLKEYIIPTFKVQESYNSHAICEV